MGWWRGASLSISEGNEGGGALVVAIVHCADYEWGRGFGNNGYWLLAVAGVTAMGITTSA